MSAVCMGCRKPWPVEQRQCECGCQYIRAREWGEVPEPRCKYGCKLNGCELGHPGCICADEAVLEDIDG